MIGLISVLVIVLLSLVVTRIATVALSLTGLSQESARFQARSALTGVGFTTSESESIVSHPVRRRIVLTLMLVGSAGIVTAVASLFISFGGTDQDERVTRGLLLAGGLMAIFLLSRSVRVDRWMSRLIARLLRARTDLDVRDYAALLHLKGDFTVGELKVTGSSWIAGRTLADLGLRDEGLVVLGIERADGGYDGVPGFDSRIEAGDTVVIYGRAPQIEALDRRRRGPDGDREHERAAGTRTAPRSRRSSTAPPGTAPPRGSS